MDLQKTSTESLIPSTNKNQVVTQDRKAFSRFLKVYESAGGKVDEISIYMTKKSIERHQITIDEIEEAMLEAYESEKFITWAAILKHVDRVQKEINKPGVDDWDQAHLKSPAYKGLGG